MPARCPECDTPLVHEEGEAIVRCDGPACPAQRRARLLHWAARNAMDIAGLGEAVVAQLVGDGTGDPQLGLLRRRGSRIPRTCTD